MTQRRSWEKFQCQVRHDWGGDDRLMVKPSSLLLIILCTLNSLAFFSDTQTGWFPIWTLNINKYFVNLWCYDLWIKIIFFNNVLWILACFDNKASHCGVNWNPTNQNFNPTQWKNSWHKKFGHSLCKSTFHWILVQQFACGFAVDCHL